MLIEREIFLTDESQTVALGRRVAQVAEPGDVIFLEGELGAGKTTLARAIAYGLGVPTTLAVTSPTFSLVHEYSEGRIPLVHADLYRLDSAPEAYELGLDEGPAIRGLLLVEWGRRLEEALPVASLEVRLEFSHGDGRCVRLTSIDDRGCRLMKAFQVAK